LYANNSYHIGFSELNKKQVCERMLSYANLYHSRLDLECPYYPEFDTPLHKYQRENISWLLELEKNHKFTYDNTNEILTISNGVVKINKFTGKFYNDISTNGEIDIPYAFLCDNVGYGKTISALTYINNSTGKSLIVVPRRLMKQWEDEIKKYLPNLKYKTIYTLTDYKKFIESDIVLVSDTFIFGASYAETDKKLHSIEWDRIVVDEIHELKNGKIASLPTRKFLVGLTATPTHFMWNECMQCILNKYIIQKHFRKTDSIIDIPPYVKNIVKLEFSEIENALYKAANNDDKFKICTSSSLAVNGDIKEVMLKSFNTQIANIEALIEKNNEKMEDATADKLKYRMNRDTELKIRIRTIQDHIETFKNLKPTTSCSICDAGYSQYISPFGHQYCSACIFMFPDEFTDIAGNIVKKNSLAFNAAWGTKFTYIHEYVQTHTDDKILIFTKYESILNEIKNMLNHYAIKSRICKGNVYQIRSIIDEFKNGDVNVLLLSSERSNSGFDLIDVSKIILVDFMTDDIEKQAIGRAHRMGQTKTVEVIKLIMNNSVEDID
jgi:SNF2 family DNA or RNA helicase